jgi:LPS export ABC transporter permease LptF
MKIIERYLLRESLKTFLFGIALFTTVLVISKVQELLAFILTKGISPLIIIKLILLLLPALLSIAIPMAFTLGIILSIGRLTEQREMVAIKTVGIGKVEIIKPFIFFSIFLIIFLIFFNFHIMPLSNKLYVKTIFNTMTQKVQLIINEREFSEITNNITLYTDYYDRKNNLLKNINLRIKDKDGTLFLFAKKGSFYKDTDKFLYQFIMKDGTFSKLLKDERFFNGQFGSMTINVDLSEKMAKSNIMNFGPRSLTRSELKKRIFEEKNEKYKRKLLIEYYKKFSIPLATFALFGVAFFFALKLKVGSKAIGIFASVCLIFTYYIFMIIGFNLGENGKLSPLIAVNLPNLIFIIPSIIGLVKI